jgi:hypothetical protein
VGGSEAAEQEVGGSEAAAADMRDKLVRDAQALIKHAAGASAEDIMRDEAAALAPMYFRQSRAQRQMRATARDAAMAAAAAAAAERARLLEASAAAAAAARDKELEAQGFVRQGQKRDDVLESDAQEPDSVEPESPDDAQAVQEVERREAYRAKGFSPTRRDFAGSGATWGFEPAGYNPLDVFGWRVQRAEAAPPAAARDENSVSQVLRKDLGRAGPADAASAEAAAAAQWEWSRQAQAAAASEAQAAAASVAAHATRGLPFATRGLPFHARGTQGFPAWEPDTKGWGDEAVAYSPREGNRRAEEAMAANVAAWRQKFEEQGLVPLDVSP